MRWRIERDYQNLKQEFGLAHYEGRGWRGFHHHATLCIAAYGFLAAARRAQRHDPNSISTLRWTIAQTLANGLQRCPSCSRTKPIN